jgi:Uma2 family endonuclease
MRLALATRVGRSIVVAIARPLVYSHAVGVHTQRRYTLEDYFSLEQGSSVRHEYLAGEIFAMAGGTLAHNQIAANTLRHLGNALQGKPCRTLGSDMRLLTPAGLLTYPVGMVICGRVEFGLGRQDTVTNPMLLVEVLSQATRDYDLGEKLQHYRGIPTLQCFVALEQDSIKVQVHRRSRDGWETETLAAPSDMLVLPELSAELSLKDLYDRVFE